MNNPITYITTSIMATAIIIYIAVLGFTTNKCELHTTAQEALSIPVTIGSFTTPSGQIVKSNVSVSVVFSFVYANVSYTIDGKPSNVIPTSYELPEFLDGAAQRHLEQLKAEYGK